MNDYDKRMIKLEDRINVCAHLNAKILYNQIINNPINSLKDLEFKVYSQWGEDGIIWYLTRTIPIPNKVFVEFGVENYKEANTRFLMIEDNWSGLIMDSGHNNVENIKRQDIIWRYNLKVKESFITANNINTLIKSAGFDEDIGLLSIDIDGVDYWIWKEINAIKPRIVICEFNPVFGYKETVTVPYKEDFYRFDAHYCGIYFGASLKAIQKLGKEKGYTYLGMNSNACNAFFVRNDLAEYLPRKLLENIYDYPCHYRSAMDETGNLLMMEVAESRKLISEMDIYDIYADNYKKVKDIEI